jgi:transcriptional regulator with XRE-family HTH domain
MSTFEASWRKLASSKEYRGEFALAMLKRMVPFQVRTIRKNRGTSQAELANQSKLTQGVISRAEDPDYGNLTLNTVGRIAAGLDLAFIGKFVPFSELVKFANHLSEAEFQNLRTYEEENLAKEEGQDIENAELGAMASTASAGTNSLTADKRRPPATVQEIRSGSISRSGLASIASR